MVAATDDGQMTKSLITHAMRQYIQCYSCAVFLFYVHPVLAKKLNSELALSLSISLYLSAS